MVLPSPPGNRGTVQGRSFSNPAFPRKLSGDSSTWVTRWDSRNQETMVATNVFELTRSEKYILALPTPERMGWLLDIKAKKNVANDRDIHLRSAKRCRILYTNNDLIRSFDELFVRVP